MTAKPTSWKCAVNLPRRDHVRSYYEVRLHGDGRLRLTRVAFDESARSRKTVPCVLTVEALERLADDLVATAG